MSDTQYPSLSTYAINDYFTAKVAVEKVVNDVWAIKEHCALVCSHRGDLTGRVYGLGYCGLEESSRLLAEFERKASELKDAISKLKRELPAADSEFFLKYEDSIDYNRKIIESWHSEIEQFFNLSHKYYDEYPAPRAENASRGSSLFLLVAYVSLAYTAYHLFF